MTHWEGVPKSVSRYYGFVYLIINNLTDKKYIGRKYFWAKKRIKVSAKRKKSVLAESNWEKYTGSCKELNDDIKKFGKKNFTFKILKCFKTRSEVNYNEVKEQFIRDVLSSKSKTGEYEYYNTNILGRYFRSKE